MSLLDRRFWPVLILPILLFSCEDPSEIGLTLNPEDKVGVDYVDLPVDASMVYIDSVSTTSSDLLLSGSYSDPVFGQVETKAFTQVWRNGGEVDKDAVFDSAIFYLQPKYFYGADDMKPQKFTIHQINSPADTLDFSIYFNDDSYDYHPEPLGSAEYVISLEDSMRFVFDDDFAKDLFEKAKAESAILDKDSAFFAYFEGLAIIPDPANEAIVGFDATTKASNLTIYYHVGEGAEKDTLELIFPIVSSNGFAAPHFNYIQADRSSSIFPQVEPYKEFSLDGSIYTQAGTGLYSKLKFDSFKHFVDTTGSIIINSAELIIANVKTSLGEAASPPPGLRFYLTDGTNLRKFTVELVNRQEVLLFRSVQQNGASPFSSANPLNIDYNKANKDYFAYMTFFLQAIAEGKMDFDEVLAYPVGGGVNNYVIDSEDIKLRVYYTKFED